MQSDTPKQGPTYFPMDRVGETGNDPTFLLNRQNANSSTNLINTPNDSRASLGSPNSATGDPNADKKKATRLARILSVVLMLVSIVMFIAGIINVIFIATNPEIYTYLTETTNNKALKEPSILIYFWATPGIWASIPPFVAGLALLLSRRTPKALNSSDYNPGLPIELQNYEKNYSNAPDVYRIFAVFSITFGLPVALLLAILDAVISYWPSNLQKFVMPIIVALAAIVLFVLLLVAWYKIKDATDNEYQYIGSTYTIYETYEPLTGKQPPVFDAVVERPIVTTTQQCCPRDNSTPIVIINQPPVCQPAAPPINVVVQEQEPRRRPMPRPLPRPVPQPVPVPVPVPFPVVPRPQPTLPMFNQQRYYPNQMFGPASSGILGRPNAYRGMFLPGVGPGSFPPYGDFRRP